MQAMQTLVNEFSFGANDCDVTGLVCIGQIVQE